MKKIRKNTEISSINKGILCIMLSAFGFAMMSAFVKLSGDIPSFQKTFFRNIVSVVVAGLIVYRKKGLFFGKLENQKILIMRSIFGTVGILLNFYAIDRLVLSDANMLNKLSPFFSIIFAALFLKERMTPKQGVVVITACITAFVGALFILKPAFNLDIIPSLSGFFSGMSAGAAYTCVRALGKREKSDTIVFYFSLFSSIVTFPIMLWVYEPMKFIQLFYLLMAGVFATLGQFGITLAYSFAPPKQISIFDYTNIIFSALISFFFFGTLPDVFSVIGYILIFAASLRIFLFNKKTA